MSYKKKEIELVVEYKEDLSEDEFDELALAFAELIFHIKYNSLPMKTEKHHA